MSNNYKYTRSIILSLLGIIIFFIEINIGGTKQIPLEHLVKFLQKNYKDILKFYTLAVIVVGALLPFVNGSFKKSTTKLIFSILGFLAIPLVIMYFFNFGPSIITNENTLPYFFEKLALPVSIYIPIGSVFLSFILSYGLLEFVGVLVRKLIRPIFKTPGKSAIDAVASFVGSYALGLLITSRIYQQGKYTAKEASIIATGFSTVSVTFMIIVKDAAGLNEYWLPFFYATLIITFFTTFVVVRLRPLKTIPNEYYENQVGEAEIEYEGEVLKNAIKEAKEVALESPSLLESIVVNFKEAMSMALVVIPSLLAVGTIGVIIANHTPIFDVIGLIFYPIFYIMNPAEAMVASKAVSIGFVEMFLPITYLGGFSDISMQTRFIVASTSISTILFLSGTIPCIMGTKIPLKFSTIVVLFIERAIISIISAFLIFKLFVLLGIFS